MFALVLDFTACSQDESYDLVDALRGVWVLFRPLIKGSCRSNIIKGGGEREGRGSQCVWHLKGWVV